VRGEVIQNDMDLAASRLRADDLLQQRDELLAGVADGGLADDFSGLRIQRCIERECSGVVVLEAVLLGPAWGEWQTAGLTGPELDGALFIHAEYSRVLRWIQIESDHRGRLLLELRIVGRHVALQPVRFQVRLFPDACDQVFVDLYHGRHLAQGPMSGAVGWRLPRSFQNSGAQLRGDRETRVEGS